MTNLSSFLAKLAADPTLQEQVESLPASSREEWAAAISKLAEKNGTPVTTDDILQSIPEDGEVSEGELAGVAGGFYGGASSFTKGLEKYYDDYVKKFGTPPPRSNY